MRKLLVWLFLFLTMTTKIYSYGDPENDSIRVEMRWVGTTNYSLGRIVVEDPCYWHQYHYSDYDTLGHCTYYVKGVLPGTYRFMFTVALENQQEADGTYEIYYNGEIKYSGEFSLVGAGSGTLARFDEYFSSPYASDFDISSEEIAGICFSSNHDISMGPTYACNTEGIWVCNSETVLWEIVSGGEYISFYDNEYNDVGNTFSGLYPDGAQINIRQKKIYTGSTDGYAEIKVTWGKKIHFTRVMLNNFIPSINLDVDAETINSGETTWGTVSLFDGENGRLKSVLPGGCHYVLPADATYKVEILSGGEYINLVDPIVEGEFKVLESLEQQEGNAEFKIIADGVSPLQPVTATIRVSSSVADIRDTTLTIVINPAPYRTIVTPEMIGAGDTATIAVQKLNENGIYEDCPENQQYEIAMRDGCVYGDILAKYGASEYYKSNYFSSAMKPLMFVAADSVEGTGGTVRLKIRVPEMQQSKTVKTKKTNEQIEKIRAKLEKFYAAKRKSAPDVHKKEQAESCYWGFWDQSNNATANVEVKDGIDLIYPTPQSDAERISSEPAMPTVLCKARLKKAVSGPIKYEWDYVVYYVAKRYDIKSHPIRDLCDRWSRFVFSGVSYANSSNDITTWNVPFLKDSLKYMLVRAPLPVRHVYDEAGNVVVESSYPGDCEKEINDWESDAWKSTANEKNITERLITGDQIFTGGKVEVFITAKDQNQSVVGFFHKNVNRIKGVNPSKEQLVGISDDQSIKAIMRTESGRSQFTSLNRSPDSMAGIPIFGPPNGFGLLQIDNSPTPHEADLWNWRQNITDGINRYQVGLQMALKNAKKYSAGEVDRMVILMNAWQHYNSNHFYYKFVKGQWMKSPYILNKIASGGSVYAEMVLKNYIP